MSKSTAFTVFHGLYKPWKTETQQNSLEDGNFSHNRFIHIWKTAKFIRFCCCCSCSCFKLPEGQTVYYNSKPTSEHILLLQVYWDRTKPIMMINKMSVTASAAEWISKASEYYNTLTSQDAFLQSLDTGLYWHDCNTTLQDCNPSQFTPLTNTMTSQSHTHTHEFSCT